MNWLMFGAGLALIVGAILTDPWGRSGKAAAAYLLGVALVSWVACSS